MTDLDSSSELKYDLNVDHPKFGKRLAIYFSPSSENTSKHIRIDYDTTAQSGGPKFCIQIIDILLNNL